jgi:hypothetical protein
MSAHQYRWAAALPGLVPGAAPAAMGLATGSFALTGYGALIIPNAPPMLVLSLKSSEG